MWAADQIPKWLRWSFFALTPLVLLAAIVLQVRNEWRDPYLLRVDSDRSRAIAVAREYLVHLGVKAEGWKAYCAAKPDPDLFRYLRSKRGTEGALARALAPPVVVQVLFESRQRTHHASVSLSLQDRVLGYDIRGASEDGKAPEQNEAQSFQTAKSVLASDPRLADAFERSVPEVASIDRSESAVTRVYTWRAPVQPSRDLELAFTTSVRNGNVLSRSLAATVDPDYIRRNFRSNDSWLDAISLSYVLYVIAVVLYSLVSYGRRSTQNEVSHLRTLWMALILAILFISMILTGYDETFISLVTQNAPVPVSFIYTLLSFMIMGAALLAAIGYGGGEGDVRESYPGKLTSLDALVLGKVFSRNVGGSVLIGMSFACWFLFAMAGLKSFAASDASLSELNSVRLPYMQAPWISFLLLQPALAFLFAVGGLVQPLAFSIRWLKSLPLRWVVLVLGALLAACGGVTSKPGILSLLISILVSVPALLLPFFAYDLLAALVSFIGLSFLGNLINVSVLYPSWGRTAFWLSLVALLTLAFEFVAWKRGREWREEEVRPEYARHIAERQALEAEVSAAREAQLRLLPQAPPSIPGLSIFASCLPARVVGGDFYDFFPLGDQRLGIFIAEGGNRGLAAALSIALAKGYLMHASGRLGSPTALILRLEETLGSVLESGIVSATIAYAVVDVERGTLEYARTGSYPKLVVTSNGSTSWSESLVERTEGREIPIWEGRAAFGPGDSIIMYTDGVARRFVSRVTGPQEDWLERLAREHQDAHNLHKTLLESIGASELKGNLELEDDLTTIVIRSTRISSHQTEPVRLEGVA